MCHTEVPLRGLLCDTETRSARVRYAPGRPLSLEVPVKKLLLLLVLVAIGALIAKKVRSA